MFGRIFLIFCIITHFWCLPCADAASLINVPLNPDITDFNSETYRFIHRLLNKRVVSGVARGSLPFTRKQVASFLVEVSQKLDSGELALSINDQKRLNELLAFYTEAGTQTPPNRRSHLFSLSDNATYRFSFDLRARQRTITRLVDNMSEKEPVEGTMFVTTWFPHLYGQVKEGFAFTTNMAYRWLYGDVFDDFYPDESKYRQLEGELRIGQKYRTAINAYLKFNFPWFELQLGQDNLQWGPGYHGNLLISPNPIAIDMLKLQTTYKTTTFTAFTGILEDMADEINEKYISGHRLEGYFWDRIGFGISEVIIFGNRFEPGYLNPVNIYLINEQTISRADSRVPGSGDNILISADMRIRPIDNFEIYGEVMVDDGNPISVFKHWDTKFGILGGIYITDPFGLKDTDFHAEYAFINQYAYTHVNPVNVYKHFTTPIGHRIGADADNLWIELRRRFTDKLETVFGYELERHGQGNIDKNHPPDAPRDDVWTPLSGITQSEHRLKIGFNWVTIGHYSFYGEWARIWRRNIENRQDVHETGNEIQAKALYRF
ncbi:MAG: hypothetical protein OXI43_09330 [Candidatus Poribacteria bacterium]|nr:hypothetical protein [Candidatus Poribacteria bacterium]